ncbi:MAG: hypothetical protein GYB65_04400, partial [Chloroflexi bacterium]|nr:hypothetical protein [Chloroflexota bacterium]
MSKILIVYGTTSGSTGDVAETIADTFTGHEVDVRPLAEVTSLDSYDAVLVGGPMILGWHRGTLQFVLEHQAALSTKPVAYFITCLELARSADDTINGVPLFQDPQLGHAPKDPNKLSFKEKQTSAQSY